MHGKVCFFLFPELGETSKTILNALQIFFKRIIYFHTIHCNVFLALQYKLNPLNPKIKL